MNRNDLTGRRFGRLVAKSLTSVRDNSGRMRTTWLCACDCGHEKYVKADSLISGNTHSCGCLQRELFSELRTTHGQSSTDIYRIWRGMKRRCEKPAANEYHNYGGRGIKVCERWQSFENFFEDMGARPNGYSLDRIDNDKGYSPENCRWATARMQGRNRRGLVEVTINGTSMCLTEAVEKSGITYGTVHARIVKHGWTVEDALSVPASVGQKFQHQKARQS